MSNTNIQLFQFQGQDVKVIWIEDKKDWWYNLADVCKLLGIANASQASQRLKKEGICLAYTPTSSGDQEMLCIDEPNYFRLIFRSDKPNAIAIQDWTYEEVLPAIRKTGAYSISNDISFQGYDEISYHDVEKDPDLLRQVIQLFEDLGLTLKNKRTRLVEVERDDFPGHTFTRGKREPMGIKLYIKQVGDKVQLGVATVGKEHVIQRAFWGQDRIA